MHGFNYRMFEGGTIMKRITLLLVAVATVAGFIASTATGTKHTDQETAPVFGIKIPPGYRDWSVISVAHVGGNVDDLRVKLGNDIAIKAYREGKPFPDGAIIARLAWRQVTSEENNKTLRGTLERRGLSTEETTKILSESFVAGPATNVQFMVKDSKKYASTGA